MKPLTASAGKGGVNRRHDVREVQSALNNNIAKLVPLDFLEEDGWCGDRTIGSIIEFQRRVVGLSNPDGRVDPNGKTYQALGGTLVEKPKVELVNWSGDSSQWSHEKKLASMDAIFRDKVKKVLANLKKQGHQPKIFFAWRSIEVQRELKKKGRSKVDFSFHNATVRGLPSAYAADIIDRRYGWDSVPQSMNFFKALGKEAKAVGLYWGGDWKSFKDWAHIQRFPNSKLKEVRKASAQ